MTDPRVFAARGAYDAARTALAVMLAADGSTEPSAVAVSGGDAAGRDASRFAAPSVASRDGRAARARAAWDATERVLCELTGRHDLSGRELISEVRQAHDLSLGEAHALAALRAMADQGAPVTDDERTVARDVLIALDRMIALRAHGDAGAREGAAGAAAYIDHVSSLGRGSARDATRDDVRDPHDASEIGDGSLTYVESPRSRWRLDSRLVVGTIALLLVAVIGVAIWYGTRGRDTESLYRDAVAAYQRGARETSRIAFARVAQEWPDDPRPLIFLGRIAREDREMDRSRRFLEAAIQRDPQSALAQREFAATMLADGQPELARRFYVRAIELDPTDRTAQGFLGCTLHRLGRFDEAQRWLQRAGPGDWMACVTPPSPPPMP